ncbi:hypothetical protein LTR62_008676 [Meristemomyces frigidus]|uniref:Carboxypeptidase n=1 Tax=Meristemomyces frigidus TaxID=1508187 RepID=A0AAN7T9C4_9PEZI|nr:hypothetical protein LTR62_008676 [Meristemomyces frigidus]
MTPTLTDLVTIPQFFTLPSSLLALVACFAFAEAQYPPPASYQNILNSPLDPRITVAYKQPPAGTCTTAYATQKQYTGYIGLPPYTLAPIQQNYSINTFFWFVEARQVPESAPLTIWLNGGPGASSMVGMFNEVGPCEVIQTEDGSYGTAFRKFGWDRSSNMLFIDQPNQVGFSYDTATNASYDLFRGEIIEPPTGADAVLPEFMYVNGTFGTASSGRPTGNMNTANTTEIAAAATWHFLQTWLAAFPQYNPAVRPNVTTSHYGTNAPVGVNLFTESYGGKFGPVFARYFEERNQLRSNGSLPNNSTLAIQLESVGIINGLVDDLIQDATYPSFAYNNTYDIQAITITEQLNEISAFSASGGCKEQIVSCRQTMNATDPEGYGDVATTNALCEAAQIACLNVSAAYYANGYDPYDIRQKLPSPDPPAAYQEYLNNASVLAAIGARVNYTESSPYVQNEFISTGDTIRGGLVEDLAYLLRLGVRVALIYGDADYICNWFGGEAVSLAIAATLPDYPVASPVMSLNGPSVVAIPASYASAFPAAGYGDIVVNSTYVGGATRQYGNLSFSRIYNAGHFVSYFQPETAFTVFTRIIQGDDLSTGDAISLSTFTSNGPLKSNYSNTDSYSPAPTCWLRSWNATCSAADTKAMLAGEGQVFQGMFIANQGHSVTLPTSTVAAGVRGHPVSTSSLGGTGGKTGTAAMSETGLTGVYTATATPFSTHRGGAAGSAALLGSWRMKLGPAFVVLLAVGVGGAIIL